MKEDADVSPAVTMPLDSEAVDYVLSRISTLLGPSQQSEGVQVGEKDISGLFDKIFNDIKGESDLSSQTRELMALELNVAYASVKDNSRVTFNSPENRNAFEIPKSFTYYASRAPYCVVIGPGPVGQRVQEKLTSLGKAVDVRFIDGSLLSTMADSELKFAVKDAKTLIIAADSAPPAKEPGWFDKEVTFSVLSEKSLKRLLNTVVVSKTPSTDVKVVALGKASKEIKSISTLFTAASDASSIDSDIIVLQCRQRGLGYCVLNVGKVVADDAKVTGSQSTRPLGKQLTQSTQSGLTLKFDNNPIIFTRSRVETVDVTRIDAAAEAMLRAVGHVSSNYTVNLLSRNIVDSPGRIPSDEEWDDEFVKMIGPELERIPLLYASPGQLALKLQKIGEQFAQPGSAGLITPIKIKKFQNGLRIEFLPKIDTYKSAREEKRLETLKSSAVIQQAISKGKSSYISPEQELIIESTENPIEPKQDDSKKVPSYEGGLEVLVDSISRRVRIRRCNMAPQTIVKEESEATLLKAILKVIQITENDYKIMLENKGSWKFKI